jgi:hypothetical protein
MFKKYRHSSFKCKVMQKLPRAAWASHDIACHDGYPPQQEAAVSPERSA